MSLTLAAELPPLRADEHGSIRVGRTRVLLEQVVRAYQAGQPPERIAERFDTLDLADVFGALTYYLRHRAEVEDYMARREAEAADVRARIERDLPPYPSKAELLSRR